MDRYLPNFLSKIKSHIAIDDEGKIKGEFDRILTKFCMPGYEDKVFPIMLKDIEKNRFYVGHVLPDLVRDVRKSIENFISEIDSISSGKKKIIIFIGAALEKHLIQLSKELEDTRTEEMKKARGTTFVVSVIKASYTEDPIIQDFLSWVKKRRNVVIFTENLSRSLGECGDPWVNYICHNEAYINDSSLVIEFGFLDHRIVKRKLVQEIKDADLVGIFGVSQEFLTESVILNGLISLCESGKEKGEKTILLYNYEGIHYPILSFLREYAKKSGIKLWIRDLIPP